MPRDDVRRATHGPLLSTRDRRALAICVVFGLLGWIVIFRLVDMSLPPEQRTVEGPAVAGTGPTRLSLNLNPRVGDRLAETLT